MFSRYWLCSLAALLVALAAGCPTPSPGPASPAAANPPAAAARLKLLVVDDAPLGDAIAREWKSRTEGTLDVQHVKLNEVLSASRLPGDVVIFPVGHLGHLVERELIVPLDDQALADADFDRRDIFDQIRLRDMAWGNRTVAVPLGSPQLLLAYRRDVFEKLAIEPPRTWEEYARVVERLAAEAQEGERPLAPTIEPLADGWAGNLLLARAASYVTHRDQVSPLFHLTTLEPLLTTPPYVKALEELVAARGGAAAEQQFTPADALEELSAGRAAMALTWAAPQRGAESGASKPSELSLAFAPLPGSAEVFNFATKTWEPRSAGEELHVPLLGVSGRLAAVTSTATSIREAQNLLTWLAGREISPLVAPASNGTTLFRASHVAAAGRWTGGLDPAASKSYATALVQSAALPRFLALRLPGRDEYLQALDAAVHAAVSGENTPDEALAAASARWQEITAALDTAKQRRALQRSLGLESLP
jgi:ABC-type glycerol-3-phosphate transport system substrate-binding protein